MAYFNSTQQQLAAFQLGTSNYSGFHPTNSQFLMRFGPRDISVCRDFRKRFYPTNRFIECRAGTSAGHVEVLLLRRWLIIFSKAQY